jgi:hypothetical protein
MGAFPSRSPANRKQGNPISLMPTVSPHITDIFCLLPRSTEVFIKLRYDLETKLKKSNQHLFSFFALSNYTTFSQTQTGATVPLKTPSLCWIARVGWYSTLP